MNRIHYVILMPLSFLVIITVLAIPSANLGLFGKDAGESTLAKWGPAGALAEIIGLYVFVARIIFAGRKSIRYSLLIASPKSMPNLDIGKIEWDEGECYIINSKLKDEKERVRLLPSLVGPTLRVHIPQHIIDIIFRNREEPIELKLRDRKGNSWEVKPFYLFENVQNLSLLEDPHKIIQDYGEEQ